LTHIIRLLGGTPHYLNKTYSKVHIGKHLSDNFPIQKGLKQGDALSPLLFNFALEYHHVYVGCVTIDRVWTGEWIY
jgi:hypothetical protein